MSKATGENIKPKRWIQQLESLEKVIINLNENNIDKSVEAIMNLKMDETLPCPNITLSRLIYSAFLSQMKDFNTYILFMNKIESNKSCINLINTFAQFLLNLSSQESFFLLDKMIELKLIPENFVENKHSFYFVHHMTNETINKLRKHIFIPFSRYFQRNYESLAKNDWELHKQLTKAGVNPNEIAKIIRNDEIEKLQEISSENDFDFNQIISPSLYERCSFINQKNVSLIDYAAFFSAVKCFKYLLLNNANVNNKGKYAVAGGNIEIIHLCEQNNSSFEGSFEAAIKFHRNDIFHYIYENKIVKCPDEKLLHSFLFYKNESMNFKLLNFMLDKKGNNFDFKKFKYFPYILFIKFNIF